MWKSSALLGEGRFSVWAVVSAALTNSANTLLTLFLCVSTGVSLPHMHSSGSDQSQREEDFYYTKISCDTVDPSSGPGPAQQALGQASSCHLSWASCGSPPGSELLPAHRPRSNSSSGPGLSRPSQLSQSAPSSFWQIHSEHLYQVGRALLLSDFLLIHVVKSLR